MAEYIGREAFIKQERQQYCEGCARRTGLRNGNYVTLYEIGEAPCRACEIDDVLNDVENFPAADARPVVRGKWKPSMRGTANGPIQDKDEWYGPLFLCSECGADMIGASNFCPNCGADMREPPKEE